MLIFHNLLTAKISIHYIIACIFCFFNNFSIISTEMTKIDKLWSKDSITPFHTVIFVLEKKGLLRSSFKFAIALVFLWFFVRFLFFPSQTPPIIIEKSHRTPGTLCSKMPSANQQHNDPVLMPWKTLSFSKKNSDIEKKTIFF